MTDAQQSSHPATPAPTKSMDEIMALCKRRGFVFQASEIYGGINGFWDYGPLGAQLKKNLRDAWWQDVVLTPPEGPAGKDGKREPVEMVGLDTCIIQHPKVWEASGHIAGFNDPMVDCTETKKRYRADKAWVVGFWSAADWDISRDLSRRIRESNTQLEAKLHQDRTDTETLFGLLRTMDEKGPEATDPSIRNAILAELQRMIDEPLGPEDQATQEFHRAMVPTVLIAVEADGEQQATERARSELGRQQIKRLGTLNITAAFNQVSILPVWPRLSPATQRATLTQPRQFNLMFKTFIGATATEDDVAYLRPETAQGIFVNFKNVVDTSRVRVPFGIAQTGKAFRNEVTPRNFTFRSREFEQMEIEFFCHESEATAWYAFWRDWRMAWWRSLGLSSDNLQLREHDRDELAHYAKEGAGTSDIEYRFPFTAPGFGELEGVAHRGNFDLRQHQEHAKVKLDYFDTERGEINPKSGQPFGERYLPHVIEPSAGLDRGVLALLCEAYTPDPTRPSGVYMKFHPRIAPIKAAVFPLVNKDGMPEKAEPLHRALRKRFGVVEYDAKQSIGKRYARMDEAGCPFCFTIDGQTMTDDTVTIRHRDSQQQERMPIGAVPDWLAAQLGVS